MPNIARPTSHYVIEVPAFSGPLDLLLHLISREELDITAISLAKVTEQYLLQVETMRDGKIEHLIDFLVVGARLLLIKSRALLPQPATVTAEEEEEDPADALIRQLRLYKQFKDAASWLAQRNEAGLRTYLRVAPPPKLEGKLDLTGLDGAALRSALLDALSRVDESKERIGVVRRPKLTIEGQLNHLRSLLSQRERLSFRALLSERTDRVEVAVTLLAALELIKRKEVRAYQRHLFGPIELEALSVGGTTAGHP